MCKMDILTKIFLDYDSMLYLFPNIFMSTKVVFMYSMSKLYLYSI